MVILKTQSNGKDNCHTSTVQNLNCNFNIIHNLCVLMSVHTHNDLTISLWWLYNNYIPYTPKCLCVTFLCFDDIQLFRDKTFPFTKNAHVCQAWLLFSKIKI